MGGLVDVQSDANLTTGYGTINNRGLFRKSGGTGTTTISASFNNLGGTIEVDSGTLTLVPGGGTLSSNGTFNVSAGAELDLASGYYQGTFTGSGGGKVFLSDPNNDMYAESPGVTLNFPGAMFQWTGGSLSGDGSSITNLGTITAAGTGPKTLSAPLYTGSGVFIVAGTGDVGIASTLHNLAGGTVDIQSDANMTRIGVINNWGLFRKSGGPGTTTISPAFNNFGGVIEVDSGELVLAGNGNSGSGIRSNGTFNVSAGAVLDLTGGGGPHFKGTFTGSGNGTVISGDGHIYIDSPGVTLNFPGAMFQWTGGVLDGNGGSITNLGTITATGAGTKTLAAPLYTGSGVFIVAGTGTIAISSTLNNMAGGMVDIQSDANMTAGGTINNSGLFRKSAGTGSSVISPTFNNQNGAIEVDSGTLSLASGNYAQGSGALTVALGGRGAGQAGQLSVSATATLGGPLSVFLTNGFALATGDRFQLLSCYTRSGTFSTASLPVGTSLQYSNNGVFLVVTSAAPVLITSPALSGTNFTLSFITLNSQSYTIERNDNLATTNWVFQTNFFGNGSLMQVVVPVTNATQRFFRVRQP